MLVRSGFVNLWADYLRYVDISGFYWSKSAMEISGAYNFYFGGSGVYPFNDTHYRYSGFSLRCLQE